jgi:hypothetical protein
MSLWRGPYLTVDTIPPDPWEHPYVYRRPGIHGTNGFDLYSCGPDGISKTGGADRNDINSWDPSSPHSVEYAHNPQDALNWVKVWAALLVLSVVVAWWNQKHSQSEGNWHGVIGLIWILAMTTAGSAMDSLDLPDDIQTGSGVLLLLFGLLWLLSLVVACGLAVSGVRRGRLISRIYGWIVIGPLVLFLMWILFLLVLEHFHK